MQQRRHIRSIQHFGNDKCARLSFAHYHLFVLADLLGFSSLRLFEVLPLTEDDVSSLICSSSDIGAGPSFSSPLEALKEFASVILADPLA